MPQTGPGGLPLGLGLSEGLGIMCRREAGSVSSVLRNLLARRVVVLNAATRGLEDADFVQDDDRLRLRQVWAS